MLEHLIKKYPNRRLYDMTTSQYITLSDLKVLIVSGAIVKVEDSKNQNDLTRNVLLQIITEAESAGDPIFSTNMLQQLIRFYGSTHQRMFAQYMEDGLQMIIRQQTEINKEFTADPVSAMTKMAEQNVKTWQDMQNNFLNSFNPSAKKKPDE